MPSSRSPDDPQPALPAADDARQLMLLGQRFAAAERYDEAVETYLLALRIDPKNVGVKLALAEARRLHRQASGGRPSRTLRADVREEIRRDAIDAAQFLGLAWIYADQGSNRRAFECLDIAEARHPAHPGVHLLRGRLYFRRKDYAGAAKELDQALRLNPFDRETAITLGKACFEVRRYEEALSASVHAYLLLNDGDREGAEHLRRRIRTLKQMLGWGNRELRRLFHERQDHLHISFDRLEWHREQFLAEEGAMFDDGALEASSAAAAAGTATDGRLDAASRLRGHELFSALDDEQVFLLGGTVVEETAAAGTKILTEGERQRDLWVVDDGRVAIERATHYGNFALTEIGPGGMLGAVGYLSPAAQIADAVAKTRVRLLRIDAASLDRLLEDDTDLAVQVHWIFWRVLARQLRGANGQLEGFFGDAAAAAARARGGGRREPEVAEELPVSAARTGATVRLFREQGLSHSELITLATFSKEKRFPEGGYVFQEGDDGNEMYVVLEGRARISKYIPGGGEEALAIVGRGDFFGEMSMIDGEPRSADVRAHGGPLTVLALDQETVREVLAMDPQAALEFLQLLCRLITRRLREIGEKLIGWRILAGPGEASEANKADRRGIDELPDAEAGRSA